MTPFEIAQKYVYGEHDALTDNQEIIDMTKDIEQAIAEQLILSGVSDIVHRAELKVLENVSDYIPCEIYSQAVISSQKKRDNVR
jgi:hypothetical protein